MDGAVVGAGGRDVAAVALVAFVAVDDFAVLQAALGRGGARRVFFKGKILIQKRSIDVPLPVIRVVRVNKVNMVNIITHAHASS